MWRRKNKKGPTLQLQEEREAMEERIADGLATAQDGAAVPLPAGEGRVRRTESGDSAASWAGEESGGESPRSVQVWAQLQAQGIDPMALLQSEAVLAQVAQQFGADPATLRAALQEDLRLLQAKDRQQALLAQPSPARLPEPAPPVVAQQPQPEPEAEPLEMDVGDWLAQYGARQYEAAFREEEARTLREVSVAISEQSALLELGVAPEHAAVLWPSIARAADRLKPSAP